MGKLRTGRKRYYTGKVVYRQITVPEIENLISRVSSVETKRKLKQLLLRKQREEFNRDLSDES